MLSKLRAGDPDQNNCVLHSCHMSRQFRKGTGKIQSDVTQHGMISTQMPNQLISDGRQLMGKASKLETAGTAWTADCPDYLWPAQHIST